MTERINHAAEAVAWAEKAANPDARKTLTYTGIAQVHATLALVGQQKIANLIALGHGTGSTQIREELGL